MIQTCALPFCVYLLNVIISSEAGISCQSCSYSRPGLRTFSSSHSLPFLSTTPFLSVFPNFYTSPILEDVDTDHMLEPTELTHDSSVILHDEYDINEEYEEITEDEPKEDNFVQHKSNGDNEIEEKFINHDEAADWLSLSVNAPAEDDFITEDAIADNTFESEDTLAEVNFANEKHVKEEEDSFIAEIE